MSKVQTSRALARGVVLRRPGDIGISAAWPSAQNLSSVRQD
jgi:hypothetical protein